MFVPPTVSARILNSLRFPRALLNHGGGPRILLYMGGTCFSIPEIVKSCRHCLFELEPFTGSERALIQRRNCQVMYQGSVNYALVRMLWGTVLQRQGVRERMGEVERAVETFAETL